MGGASMTADASATAPAGPKAAATAEPADAQCSAPAVPAGDAALAVPADPPEPVYPPALPLRYAGHIGSALLLANPAWMAAMNRQWNALELAARDLPGEYETYRGRHAWAPADGLDRPSIWQPASNLAAHRTRSSAILPPPAEMPPPVPEPAATVSADDLDEAASEHMDKFLEAHAEADAEEARQRPAETTAVTEQEPKQ